MKFQEVKLESIDAEYDSKKLHFEIQRDDLLHPIVSGNKWRKLQGWLEVFQQGFSSVKFDGVLTFGGAFSNHLIATAGFCQAEGIETIGIVRGDEGFTNHYIDYCANSGMELHFVSRNEYRDKMACASAILNGRNFLVIPEGGSGFPGVSGFKSVVNSWDVEPDYVVHASATGTTALGLSAALIERGWNTRVKAVLVLKNLEEQMQLWNQFPELSKLIDPVLGYDFGGYAKYSNTLIEFVKWANGNLGFPVDPVYVGKALYALMDYPEWNEGNSIFLHTGGQWGRDSEKFKALF